MLPLERMIYFIYCLMLSNVLNILVLGFMSALYYPCLPLYGWNLLVSNASQGRNKVKWRQGQGASFSPPVFEFEVFWQKMYYIEESTYL